MTDIVALAATIRNEMQERTDRLLGAACSAIEKKEAELRLLRSALNRKDMEGAKEILTEAELMKMREVQQASLLCGEWTLYDEAARADWPRVTEWALEARRLLEEYATGTISDAEMVPQVRRLLGGE